MIRQFIALASAGLLACAAQPPAIAQVPERIDWTLQPPSPASSGDRYQLTLSYRTATGNGNWSNGIALDELVGIDPSTLSGEGGSVAFRIVREAGSFACEGIARRRRGTGECRFEADAAFVAELARRGIGAPTESQQFRLALARVSVSLLNELDRRDYPRPDVDELIRAGIHGVDAAYVRDLHAAGFGGGALDGLVRMRIHGVTAAYVGALAEAGYRPDAATLQRLAIHNASSDFVREMRGLGYGGLSAEELVRLRIHGLTADYVRELRSLGYERLSAGELQRMRIHGVTPEFVRRAIGRGGARPTAAELIRRRIHGG